MSALRTYLWKEWREQRNTLVVLALSLIAGVSALVLALPRHAPGTAIAFHGIAAVAVVVVAMSVGSDLLSRERQGSALTFLERMPRGLAIAFGAKLLFFLAALAAALAFGGALAASAALLRTGALPTDMLLPAHLQVHALLFVAALWVFAVSAWMQAGALAFPTALLLLAALSLPAMLTARELRGLVPSEVLPLAALWLLGAPCSAWASFVLGSRLGRSRARAALVGLLVAMAFFSPSWAWAASHFTAHLRAAFRVRDAFVGADPRFAYLNLERIPPAKASDAERERHAVPSALIVDLEAGTHRFAGSVDGSAFVALASDPWRAFTNRIEAPARLRLLDERRSEMLLDTATAALESRPVDPAAEATSPALSEHRRLSAGLGGPSSVLVRPGRWIVCSRNQWRWYDPESKASEPFDLARAGDPGPSVSDGRILLRSEEGLFVLDPESGERLRLQVDCEGTTTDLRHASSPYLPLPADAPCFVSFTNKLGPPRRSRVIFSGFGWLDLRARTLVPVVAYGSGPTRLLHVRGRQAIVLEGRSQVVRYDAEQGSREVLFSVDELD